MQSIKIVAWLTLAFASLLGPVTAADDLMSTQLADQARHWQQKNRDDLAADLWRKLLLTDPKHSEALVKLGVIEVYAGNLAEAESLYNRAAQLAPRPAGLNELSAALDTARGGSKKSPPQPKPQLQARPLEPIAKASPVKPAAPAPVKPAAPAPVKPAASAPVNSAAVLSRPKASAKAATTAAGPASSQKGSTSPPPSDAPQLIFSTSLDLVPVKPGP
jgi:tetratricopeptide (TPR) repeat protein